MDFKVLKAVKGPFEIPILAFSTELEAKQAYGEPAINFKWSFLEL